MDKAELQMRCQGDGGEKHIERLLETIEEQFNTLEASTERTPTHIYCENCGSIQPMLQKVMNTPAVSGGPFVGGDLLCGNCKRVIATVWKPARKEKWTPEEWAELGGCPDCGGNTWLHGPRGGICQNYECGVCGHHFDVSPMGVDRI